MVFIKFTTPKATYGLKAFVQGVSQSQANNQNLYYGDKGLFTLLAEFVLSSTKDILPPRRRKRGKKLWCTLLILSSGLSPA